MPPFPYQHCAAHSVEDLQVFLILLTEELSIMVKGELLNFPFWLMWWSEYAWSRKHIIVALLE